MRDTNLVNALLEHAEWAQANEWEAPIPLCDDLAEAADLIEAQAKEIDALRNELYLKCGEGKKMERDIIGAMRTAFEQSADRIVAAEESALVLKKEIEKLRGQLPRWIPVEERLPENFKKVLCWGEYFRYGDFNAMFADYALGYQINGNWGGEVTNGTKARALAWMPLPEPPEVENAEAK